MNWKVLYQKKTSKPNPNKLLRIDDNIDLSSYVDNSGWILLDVIFFRREKYILFFFSDNKL